MKDNNYLKEEQERKKDNIDKARICLIGGFIAYILIIIRYEISAFTAILFFIVLCYGIFFYGESQK